MKISRALISVSDKTEVADFARRLAEKGVEIISTGGTAELLRKEGVEVTDVSAITGFPEIMEGRVKTLHPGVHGGILAKRGKHDKEMRENGIKPIDIVVVNLYPFEQKPGIENIDVGGPAMIRAAAKNHEYVAVLTDAADYGAVAEEIEKTGEITLKTRKRLAVKAFRRTAEYDAAISAWLADEDFPEKIITSMTRKEVLRYGENPHQKAAFYSASGAPKGLAAAFLLQGKEMSYNNISDTDAALMLVSEFSQPAVAIIKHANPCGVGIGNDAVEAYRKALASDPVSAFGGIVAVNREINGALATEIAKVFTEVIIAPAISGEAREVFAAKKNLRVLELPGEWLAERFTVKSVQGGFLVQENDLAEIAEESLKTVSRKAPEKAQIEDLLFAFKVARHVKSNAIVIAKDGATVGIGAGQMNRVGSVKIAAAQAGEKAQGAALASDAFFPFADGVLEAAKAGVSAIIHPGGSIRDEEVIKAADDNNIAMVLSGIRVFKH